MRYEGTCCHVVKLLTENLIWILSNFQLTISQITFSQPSGNDDFLEDKEIILEDMANIQVDGDKMGIT